MSTSPAELIEENRRIIKAIMLRDMKTRFGGSYLSYLVTVGWPLLHMATLFAGYILVNAVAPVGDDPAIFVMTGIAPYILCLYPARWMTISIITNKQLLQFPVVRPMHLIISRITLEIMTAYIVFIIFSATLMSLGYALAPHNMLTALIAVSTSILLGISLGMVGLIFSAVFGFSSVIIMIGIMISMYLTAGIFIPSIYLSESVRNIVEYNPIYHCVGIFRSAYYDSYITGYFSVTYVIILSLAMILIGLSGERLLRGKLIAPL